MKLPNLRPRTLDFIAATLWLSAIACNANHIDKAWVWLPLLVSSVAVLPFGMWCWARCFVLLLEFYFWCRWRAEERRRERVRREILRMLKSPFLHGNSLHPADRLRQNDHPRPPEP